MTENLMEEQLIVISEPLVCGSLNFKGSGFAFSVRSRSTTQIRIKIFGCLLKDSKEIISSSIKCYAAASTMSIPQCSVTTITTTVAADIDGTANFAGASNGAFATASSILRDTSCSAERTTAIVVPMVMLLLIIAIIAIIIAVVYLLMSKGNKRYTMNKNHA